MQVGDPQISGELRECSIQAARKVGQQARKCVLLASECAKQSVKGSELRLALNASGDLHFADWVPPDILAGNGSLQAGFG